LGIFASNDIIMRMDQLKRSFNKERIENIQMLSFIAGYNSKTLSETDHDKLDEWITRNDFNQWLFEMFIDDAYAPVLKKISDSFTPKSNSL
jgi:hypothetical protein